MNQFIEDLLKTDVMDAGYKAMAADQEREDEALEWCNAITKNIHHEPKKSVP